VHVNGRRVLSWTLAAMQGDKHITPSRRWSADHDGEIALKRAVIRLVSLCAMMRNPGFGDKSAMGIWLQLLNLPTRVIQNHYRKAHSKAAKPKKLFFLESLMLTEPVKSSSPENRPFATGFQPPLGPVAPFPRPSLFVEVLTFILVERRHDSLAIKMERLG
jgi:hypothetical protein